MPAQLAHPLRRLDSRARRYFAALEQAYGAAASEADRALDLVIADQRLRVHFASSEPFEELAPAIDRLQVPETPGVLVHADSRLHVWDTASTGVRVPPFPWSPDQVGPGGSVIGYDEQRFRTLYRDDGAGFHSLAMYDTARRVGYLWFADHARIDWYERAEPLRSAIHWSLAADRRFLAHASAVGDERGAVLLAGRGGAGKTTTTLASLAAGLRFVGDNYVLLSLENQPEVHGLYGTAKLWPETLALFPNLSPYVRTFDVQPGEKLVVDVGRYRPDGLASRLPLRAVVAPTVAGRKDALLRRCSRVDALLALAPTTVLQLPRTGRGLGRMADLVKAVPTYTLELADDLSSGPAAISELLDELAGTS